MKKNPLEQAFRKSQAVKKYADGALVTAQTGQTDPITNVGTGSSGLGELIWEPIRDIFQTGYTAPEVNTGITEQPVTPTVVPQRPYDPREYASYEDAENYSPIGYVNPSGRQFYEYEPITYTGPAPTDLTRFQTAFDPKTGRMFYSPAEALAYGVTDYVLSTPTGLPKPPSLANTSDEEIAKKASRFGISPDAYMNYYRQIDAAKPEQEYFNTRLSTQNDNMPIEDLVAKLQYYDANPPKDFQELQEQRVLWADYNQRYASSQGTYENLGGVGQNWELQPERNFFAPTVTGYANSLDQVLNEYAKSDRTQQEYYKARDFITENPSIDRILTNAEAMLGRKPFEGTDANFNNARMRMLQGQSERIGEPYAESNMYRQLADEYAASLPFGSAANADPKYRALREAQWAVRPVVNDTRWETVANRSQGNNPERILWRDPETGRGFGYEKDQGGYLLVYGPDGSPLSGALTKDSGDVIKLLDDYSMTPEKLKSFNDAMKQSAGVDMAQTGLNVEALADKSKIAEIASDKYVQDVMANYDRQQEIARNAGFATPSDLSRTTYMQNILSQQAAAKALLGNTTPPAAKDGGAIMMKRGGHVDLEKEFRLADMIDKKGMGSAKKSNEPVQKFALAGLVKKTVQAGSKMAKKDKGPALPLDLVRAKPKTKQEITDIADRVARQQSGEFVRKSELSGNPKHTQNLAGRSGKEVKRLEDLDYTLERTKDIRPTPTYESEIGDINVAIPGDQTIADFRLVDVDGRPIDSIQQGGSLYGEGKLDLEDPLFWASEEGIAQILQDKITKLAQLYNTDKVTAYHLAMGQDANNFAMHFADANLKAIANSDLSPEAIEIFNQAVREGPPHPKTGKKIPMPHFAGIENPEEAYLQMLENPMLRKWFNNRMKIDEVTTKIGLPSGKDIQWAITEPALRNMEINLTGHSVGRMKPFAELTDTADHATYAKGIQGESLGKAPEVAPFELAFPDADLYLRSVYAPSDLTGTMQKVFPHQKVDQQQLDQMSEYYRRLREIRGYKEGGSAELEKEFKGKSRLIPKAVIDALDTKRKLSPAEAKIAGEYAKPENQWNLGSILEEFDPVYTVGRGAETLKNVDYGAIKDLLLQRYQLEKNPRAALEKELGQLGEAMFGALDVAPLGAVATKPARKAIKSLAQKFEGVPVGLSIEDVTPKSVNFVSAVEKSIKGHKMESMNGEQWANWMRANASKSAKKEAEATGLYDWLKSQGKVSKADIEAYVEGNLPQITKIEKGAPLKLTSKDEIRLSELHRRNTFKDQEPLSYDEYNELMRLENIRDKTTPEDLMRQSQMFEESARKAQAKGDKEAADSLFKRSEHMAQRAEALELNPLEVGGSRFEKWKEPGGERYREVTLSIPPKPMSFKEYVDYNMPGARDPEKYRADYEAYLKSPDKTSSKENFRVPSAHAYGDPEADINRLLHYRANERLTPEGKKATFLEELQSDWAQKARKTGIKQDVTDDVVREYYETHGKRGDNSLPWEELPSKDKAFLRHIIENRQVDAVPNAPYITDTGDWTKLGLKQALKDAIEGGHDYLAWTTGEQQAKRYDLSKQVSEIAYHPKGKALEVFDLEGNNIINEEGINPEDLADYIGKEAAEKLMNSTEIDRGYNILKGDNIRVGGEGMKGYYDRMVPQYMRDILKQYGIADDVKPIDVELFPAQRASQYDSVETTGRAPGDIVRPARYSTQMGIEITPELREKILNEGLTHFNEGGTVNNGLKRLVSRFDSEYPVPFPRDN